MKIDRRSFLSLGIGVAAGTAFSPLPWKLMDDVSIWTQNWPWTPVPAKGESTWVNSVCTLCPGSCGISVRKVDDRGVKIEGMKDHPVNQGGICALGLAGLQLLYSPDRVKTPLKRAGKRGEGKWVSISWDQAISEVAGKLKELRTGGQAHTVAGITGSGPNTLSRLFKRFLTAYGSPNFFNIPSIDDSYRLALQMMNGATPDATVGLDLENTDFILSFGCGLLDGWGSPVHMFKTNTAWRKTQARVIQIEPRLSRTAAKAYQWIPITPGSEGALALGIANVLITESLYRKDFVDNYTSGFEGVVNASGELQKGFKQHVLDNFSPKAVSELTGLDPAAITLLAREFAKAKAPIALFGRGQGKLPGSMDEALAIHALNMLMGAINQKGGIYALPTPDSQAWPVVPPDAVADSGVKEPRLDGASSDAYSRLNQLPPAVLSGKPYPLNALLVMEANPLYTMSNSKAVQEAFDKIPLVVSFSSFMDETAQNSDLILPNHIYLERQEDAPLPAGFSKPVISLSKAVFKPLHNTQHAGDTLILLAKGLGGSVAETLPWKDFEACLKQAMGDKMEPLQKTGYWVNTGAVFPDGKTTFTTPSGKFEFASSAFCPGFTPVKIEGDASYPLLLIPYDTMRLASGYAANPPFDTKILEETILLHQDGLIEINPKTAQSMGLSENDRVLLQTPRGQANVLIHLEEGIMPGVIALPRGLGHTAYDAYIAGKGVNLNGLTGPVADPISGLDAAWGIKAKLSKA